MPPEYLHHGLILGEDGKKLSKRAPGATVAALREAGIPPEAVRAYLEELGMPAHDVHYDLAAHPPSLDRGHRLRCPTTSSPLEPARPSRLVPVLRGARDLAEAREYAASVTSPPEPGSVWSPETLVRFRELRERANGELSPDDARSIVRELKAVGGDLKQLRTALTGRERGPELWAVRRRASARGGPAEDRCSSITPLTRRLDELPEPPGPVRMYFCGPTVYARAHIGNARPYILGIWLRSWLRLRGYDATLVHNITDINDKIYEAAPGASAELAERATQWYLEDTGDFGLGRPDHMPKASEVDPRDRRLRRAPDRGGPRLCGRRRRLLPRRAASPSTAASPGSGPTRSRSRSRTRSRRTRATSRSGRRTSRARTPGGTRRGAAAGPAGTSSAR